MPHIEVEQKFSLNDTEQAALLEGAELVKEYSFTDTYYDLEDFSLSCSNRWLRDRDGIFEMKVPSGGGHDSVDIYHEVTDEKELRRILDLGEENDFIVALSGRGYVSVASYRTDRKKYAFGEFTFDLDVADFGYAIAEIEVITDESETDAAAKRILDFAATRGIVPKPIGTKLIAYAKLKNVPYYEALFKAGIVKGD